MTEPEEPHSAEPPSWWPRGIVTLFSEVAVLTAVLYYFGWAYTQAVFHYYGLDVRWFDLSTADYVMRSLRSVFYPLLWACLAAVAVSYLHSQYLARPRRRTAARVTLVLRLAAGVLAVLVVTAYLVRPFGHVLGIGLPLIFALSAGLAGYADFLAARTAATRTATADPAMRIRAAALVGLALIGVFWALSLYASDAGERVGKSFIGAAPGRSDVLVYSTDRIAIAGTGVSVAEIPAEDSRYHYRYDGLRILLHTKDRFVLVPALWRRGEDTVIVIPDDEHVRIDVLAR